MKVWLFGPGGRSVTLDCAVAQRFGISLLAARPLPTALSFGWLPGLLRSQVPPDLVSARPNRSESGLYETISEVYVALSVMSLVWNQCGKFRRSYGPSPILGRPSGSQKT